MHSSLTKFLSFNIIKIFNCLGPGMLLTIGAKLSWFIWNRCGLWNIRVVACGIGASKLLLRRQHKTPGQLMFINMVYTSYFKIMLSNLRFF